MAREIKTVPVGSLQIDCSAMASFIQDLAPGELQGKKVTQDGYNEAAAEILSNQPIWGSQIGITDGDIAELQLSEERIALIDAQLPAVRKLLELLEETRAQIDDVRHRRIAEIAKLVDARSQARRSTELLAAYQKTRAYRSASALKGVKTRRRNQELETGEPIADEPSSDLVS